SESFQLNAAVLLKRISFSAIIFLFLLKIPSAMFLLSILSVSFSAALTSTAFEDFLSLATLPTLKNAQNESREKIRKNLRLIIIYLYFVLLSEFVRVLYHHQSCLMHRLASVI